MNEEHHNTKVDTTWAKIYALVLGVLVVIIFLLYVFTQHFQ